MHILLIQICNGRNFVAVWAPVGYKSALLVCGSSNRQEVLFFFIFL
jgi:hypothetical protein